MKLPSLRFSRMPTRSECSDFAVFLLIVLSVLWKGGKSLEMTWLLTGVACFITILWHTEHRGVVLDAIAPKRHFPLVLWSATMLFVLMTFVSYALSSTSNYGFDELLRTGALAILLLWGARRTSMSDGEEFVRRLVRVLAISVIAACVIGVFVYVFQPINRFVGTFFDHRFHTDYWPNAWAEFVLLVWPIVLYWSVRDFHFKHTSVGSRFELLVRSGILGLVFGCLFLSYSRGAVLVLIAQLLVWGAVVYRKAGPKFSWKPVIPIAVLMCAVSVLTFLATNNLRANYYEVQQVSSKITFSAAEGTSSISDRTQFWNQALALSAQKPLFGWGPYSFRFVQPQLQNSILSTSDHAHNILLKFAMERGIATSIILAFIFGYILYCAASSLLHKSAQVGTVPFSLRMMVFLGILGVLLHNMIDFNLQFVGIAAPFWLLLGVLLALLDIHTLRETPKKLALWTEITLAGLLLIAAFYEGGYLVISSLGRHAEKRGEREIALEWYRRADGEIFTRDLHLSKAKVLIELGNLDNAQLALDTYFARNREDARAWKLQGDIALLQGEKQRGLDAFNMAYKRSRFNDLGVLRGLIEAELALDHKSVIDDRKEEFDALLNSYADAIGKNAHWSALSHNVEEFIAIANILARLYPPDAPHYQVTAAKVDHHAQVERDRLSSRPPGFLW